MRNVLFVAFLVFLIAGCATQGGKSADIEQRDLFDQQQVQRQQEAAKQQEAEKQTQVMREQQELSASSTNSNGASRHSSSRSRRSCGRFPTARSVNPAQVRSVGAAQGGQ